MPNRIIYNQLGVFAGPSPATKQHFIDSKTYLNNSVSDYNSGNQNFNLIKELQRIQEVSYSINTNRTTLGAINRRGNFDNYPFNSTVNINFSYLQAGIINELRMGFYCNYALTSGGYIPYYSNNFGVCVLSGFLDRTEDREENELRWPKKYRDERNLFIAVKQDTEDLNDHSDTYYEIAPSSKNVGVYGFGNCYLQSYSTTASVGSIPTVSVSYVGENASYCSSGSGFLSPAIEAKSGTAITNVSCAIPSVFKSFNVPAILHPGDITWSLASRSKAKTNAVNGVANRNLLVNGGFEDWRNGDNTFPYGWSGFSPTAKVIASKESTLIKQGSYSVKCQSSGTFSYFTQVIPAKDITSTKSSAYTVSFWYRNLATNNTQGGSIGVYNGSSYIFIDNSTLKDGDWHFYSTGYSFPDNLNQYIIWLESTSTSTTGNISYLDDFNVFESAHSKPRNLLFDTSGSWLQQYTISLDIPRKEISAMGYKRIVDRPVQFPVPVTLSVNYIVNSLQTGSLLDLINKNDDYDIAIRLRNPINTAFTGDGVRYDLRGCKYIGSDFSSSIGENKVVNLNFSTEIDPNDFSTKGFFISGLVNSDNNTYINGFLQKEDGGYLLQENGDKIIIYNGFSVLY